MSWELVEGTCKFPFSLNFTPLVYVKEYDGTLSGDDHVLIITDPDNKQITQGKVGPDLNVTCFEVS